MRPLRTVLAASSFAIVVLAASRARAVDETPSVHPAPPSSSTSSPSAFDSLVEPSMKRTWAEGSPRWFVASTFDVGFLYLRPRVSLGYGKPHRSWFGVDANPTIWGPGAGAYAGLRLSVPHFDVRVGPRMFRAFQHSYLVRRPTYDRLALESTTLGPATTVTFESEVNVDIPAGPGEIVALGSVSYVTNVPAGRNVFEETLRVVVEPPWVVRARTGYAVRFGSHDQVSVGLVGDFLTVPERRTVVVRVGALVRFALSRSFEVRGSFVPRVYSPDDIGLLDSDFTELGLRWRWATE